MLRSEVGNTVAVIERSGNAIPLAVGGLPSPESIFTIHCVAEIVRRTCDRVKVIPLNTEADAEGLADAIASEPTVPFFDTPDCVARAALLATGIPIVLVMGNFSQTAQFCMIARDLDPLGAARFVSQSFACLEPLQGLSGVRLVTLDRTASLSDWIDEVAIWLGLQPPGWHEARQQFLTEYAAWSTVGEAIHALVACSEAATAASEQLPLATSALFAALATSYHAGSIGSVFWPAECILVPAEPAVPVTGAIPLTGPTRMLTFGPFLHLPPGQWRARYQFEVDEHLAGNRLEFDVVHGGTVLVSCRTSIIEAGLFGLDCDFEIDDPRLFVENRAILVEGSIGGFFKPTGIWLTRDL